MKVNHWSFVFSITILALTITETVFGADTASANLEQRIVNLENRLLKLEQENSRLRSIINISSNGGVTINSPTRISLKATQIEAQATGTLTLKGAGTKLQATSTLTLEGVNTNLNGEAALAIKGGIIQIN